MRPAIALLVAVLLAGGLAACAPAAGPAPTGPPPKPAARAEAAARPADTPPEVYFAGKTVTLVVPLSAGGPTDVLARLFAPFLSKHVPGQPTVLVENRTGAGGLVGMNYVYGAARKDGLTMGFFSAPLESQVYAVQGIEYDTDRFVWLGGAGESEVTFVHRNLGVRTPRDLLTPGREIIVGGLRPDSSKDLGQRLFLNMIGARYKYVTGYPGNADARLALMRDEINYYSESLAGWFSAIVPLVNEGTVHTIGQAGLVKGGQIVRDPRVPDIPTYAEIAVELKGERVKESVEYRALRIATMTRSLLRAIVYPPGTPPEVAELMRKAVAEALADPEFQAAGEKQLGFQFDFSPGAEAQALAQQIIKEMNEDREALEHIRQLAKEKV